MPSILKSIRRAEKGSSPYQPHTLTNKPKPLHPGARPGPPDDDDDDEPTNLLMPTFLALFASIFFFVAFPSASSGCARSQASSSRKASIAA